MDEAALIAGFVERYFEHQDDHPGLKIAAPDIHHDTAKEIMSLRAAVSRAQAEHLKYF